MKQTLRRLPTPGRRARRLCEHALSLLVVFFMLSGTAVWTGRFFGREIGGTSAAGAAPLPPPTAEQTHELGLDAGKTLFAQRDSASWAVTQTDGTPQGAVICTQPYAREVKGFAGPVPVYIYIDEAGRVSGLAAGDNAETPDFLRRALAGLRPLWAGQDAKTAAAAKVDAVSGATYSSRAVINGVQHALAAYTAAQAGKTHAAPAIGWGRTAAVLLVLLTGVGINLLFRGHRRLRLIQQLLNVGVLGFWCGQFLSLSLLRGWIANGLDPIAALPTLLVLLVAVLMPLFKHRRHYCNWVCPLGSAQELAARLPLPKIHCSGKVFRAMTRIRLAVFSLLMLLLWTGLGGFLLNYEPFTAFLLSSALPAAIVLAMVIVVASCFVPNVWCRSLCPMGMALDLSEDTFAAHAGKNENETNKKENP